MVLAFTLLQTGPRQGVENPGSRVYPFPWLQTAEGPPEEPQVPSEAADCVLAPCKCPPWACGLLVPMKGWGQRRSLARRQCLSVLAGDTRQTEAHRGRAQGQHPQADSPVLNSVCVVTQCHRDT